MAFASLSTRTSFSPCFFSWPVVKRRSDAQSAGSFTGKWYFANLVIDQSAIFVQQFSAFSMAQRYCFGPT